ncbi:hypothetical protein GGI12_000324 [Dipsacomyces acuminosporus]|nr:hypothetical protein GGI12_000324 [Dipsacomyces acuminosporus]
MVALRPDFVFRGHQSAVNCASFFADDRFLVSGDQEGQIIVWNMLLKKQFAAVPQAHAGPVLAAVGFGDDTIVSQGRDNRIAVWRLDSSEFSGALSVKATLAVDSMSFCKYAFAQDSGGMRWIAALEEAGAGKAYIYNINTGHRQAVDIGRSLNTKSGSRDDPLMCLDLVVENEGVLGLLVGYESTTLQYFEIALGSGEQPIAVARKHSVSTAHREPMMGISYDRQRRRVYTCAADNMVCCYMLDSSGFHEAFAPCLLKNPGSSDVKCFSEMSAAPLVAVAGWDYALHILDLELNHICDLPFHRAALTSVDASTLSPRYSEHIADPVVRQRWDARTQWLAVASRDSRITLWDAKKLMQHLSAIHYSIDLVLVSTALAGIRRSTGLTPALGGADSTVRSVARAYLDIGERTLDIAKSQLADSKYFKRDIAAEASEDDERCMVIGSYCVTKELGSGSYGTVYSVKHSKTGNKYAMKVYHKASLRKRVQAAMMRRARGGGPMRGGLMRGGPGRGGLFAMRQAVRDQQDAEAADPFSLIRMELAVSKKLKHPNLVHLHEALNDPEHDDLYLGKYCVAVIDLCDGGPVQKLNMEEATSEPIDEKDAHRYFAQALLALEYLHEHDIIHRDIKPDNLLVAEDGTLRISDFGESVLLKQHGEKVRGTTGTPAFMAPELCQGADEVSGEAADIWSLGICLYSFIYGRLPFKGSTLPEVFESIAGDELKFPGPHNDHLQDLLSCLLERNPDRRITIPDIRAHPWVTQDGAYELPSKEANCQNAVLQITQEDLDSVIQPIYDIMPVIRAVAKLRRFRRRIKEGRGQEPKEA